ncbi:hypothetical protein [Clostridium paraputrificum]|uniref:Uncharacterized protein n=1 Tax=Clostridium paraputrificum TaxID=29363 RepID=A0A1B8RSW3_9CLOT|nr:hypothetical protein [Clostridium paraputrificum]OBY11870.1 hypothetical protein CP373A1_02800 [Clostridium paraputrificum]
MENKIEFDSLYKLSTYDLKQIVNLCTGELNCSDRDKMLQLLELMDKNGAYDKENLFCEYRYGSNMVDLDDSGEACEYMRVIYNILWGRNEKEDVQNILDKNGYTSFRRLKITGRKNILFGGDVANSVQTILNKAVGITSKIAKERYNNPCEKEKFLQDIKETKVADLYGYYHYIGNFVLVPAYFNGWRGTNKEIEDYFDKSLQELKENGWQIISQLISKNRSKGEKKRLILENAKKLYDDFTPEDFNKYINAMFLWDYVSVDIDTYKVNSLREGDWLNNDFIELKSDEDFSKESKSQSIDKFSSNVKYAIRRRGIFMALMLKIALDYPRGNYRKEEYSDWMVSDIYKQLMDSVFLSSKVYSGYREVFDEICKVLDVSKLSQEEIDEIKGLFVLYRFYK